MASEEYDPSKIEILPPSEFIRKRPGMYIGATDRVGAAVMLTSAADVLFGLTVDRSGARRPLIYSHHAFLDVSLQGRRAMVSLDYMASECPDFADRCAYLVANREDLWASDLETRPCDVATFPVVSALSTGLVLRTRSAVGSQTILRDEDPVGMAFPPLAKDRQIAIAFDLPELFDLSGTSQDFLEGFVRGNRTIPGVVIRSVTHEPQ